MTEQRRFHRVAMEGDATLHCGERAFSVNLVDLSLRGAMVEAAHILPTHVDSHCRLTLVLGDEGPEIPLECRITHHQGQRLGIEFVRVDVSAMQHLRRLLELNAGDEDISVENLADDAGHHD